MLSVLPTAVETVELGLLNELSRCAFVSSPSWRSYSNGRALRSKPA
jgi:hypothetical protein